MEAYLFIRYLVPKTLGVIYMDFSYHQNTILYSVGVDLDMTNLCQMPSRTYAKGN